MNLIQYCLLLSLLCVYHIHCIGFIDDDYDSRSDSDCSDEDNSDYSSEEHHNHRHRRHRNHRHPKITKAPIVIPRTCPPGWSIFYRSVGQWCMQVFEEDVNQPTAQARCQALGATLSGVQNDEERLFINGRGVSIIQRRNTNFGGIWLGAVRKNECRVPNWRSIPQCLGSNAFSWTDGVTTGQQGFVWRRNMPDYYLNVQNCVAIDNVLKPVVKSGQTWIVNARYDDTECNGVNAVGYVCGRQP